MNQNEQALLKAIQQSLWNTKISFSEDTDWDAVVKEAEDQAITGIVIHAAPVNVQEKWKSKTGFVTATFIQILHLQERLYRLLKENDITMVVLKGTAAAIYYPNPAQRLMGDIDYLVPQESFERTTELLKANGYVIDEETESSRHIRVYQDGILFEQHRLFSYEGVDVEQYITEGLSHISTRTIFGSEFPMLPKLANGLVLLGHMVQHLKSGLGLRQVIDWMMYVDRELNDDSWNQAFQHAAVQSGLEQAAIVTTRMCQIYLGLTEEIQWCKNADPKLCEELMENLLSSGNFDRKRGKGASVESVSSGIARKGFFRYLQTTGESTWEAYHRHHWLKPFAWIYQMYRFAKKGVQAKRSRAQLMEDIKRGRSRKELLQKLKIGQPKE